MRRFRGATGISEIEPLAATGKDQRCSCCHRGRRAEGCVDVVDPVAFTLATSMEAAAVPLPLISSRRSSALSRLST
jgi:hypothetical protein